MFPRRTGRAEIFTESLSSDLRSSESDTEELRRDSSVEDDDGGSIRRRAQLLASRFGFRDGHDSANENDESEATTAGDADGAGVSGGDVFEADTADEQARAVDERNQLLFERNRLQHHKRQLEDLLDNSEDSNKQLSDRVKGLETELAGLRRTGHQLKRRLEEETARADAMERRAAQAESLGASLRQEVGRLRDRNSRLRDELRHSQGSISDFLKDVAEKRASIKQLEDDLACLRNNCNRLSAVPSHHQQQQPQQQPEGTTKDRIRDRQQQQQQKEQTPWSDTSIRDEILVSQQLRSDGPSPFCGKSMIETAGAQNGLESEEAVNVSKLIAERDFYKRQLTEATERIRSTAGIVRHGLLEKFNALEREVQKEKLENSRLIEQLRRCYSRQATACSDSACQVGEPFLRSEPSRFDARFPRSVYLHQNRRLSTGLIGKFLRTGTEGPHHGLGSSVDALDLAVKSAANSAKPAHTQQPAVSEQATPRPQFDHSLPARAISSRLSLLHRPQLQHRKMADSLDTAGGDSPTHLHGNHYSRRIRKVSFGAPLNQAAPPEQQHRDLYLQDLVSRPVQMEDAKLTDQERQQNSLLLRQAAQASSRLREDGSASSPDGSPRHGNKRPSRTSSSFLSSLRESDYSLWSHSEAPGASLSLDGYSRSQSQADPADSSEVSSAEATAAGGPATVPRSQQASQPTVGDSPKADLLVPFPSLPNARLQSLSLLPASLTDLESRNGSVSLIDSGRRFRLEDIPDSELEDRVRSLAISFSNDATTLVGRVKRLFLSRTNLEQNVTTELAALEAELAAFRNGGPAPAQAPTAGLGVLRELLDKLNRTAEILGAVQQESRLNYTFHLMLKYMELLKEEKEKMTTELDQMRQAMDEGKFYMPDDDLMSKRSKSVIGAASQKENQRNKFQDFSRTVARTSSITTLRRRMSQNRKSTDDLDGDKRDSGKDCKKWKIEEEIYQSGFERGVRMATSQQLSQLKTEQAAFSDQLERMTDRQHLTEAEEADLERLSSDLLADKRLRLFLAPFTLLVTAVLLLWVIFYPIVKQVLT